MRKLTTIAAIWAILALPCFALAQIMEANVPAISDPVDAEPVASYLGLTSAVSFLDSAMPRTTIRTRFDIDNGARQPVRADFLYSSRDFGTPESSVDQQELDLYLEYAPWPWFSVFLDQPYRWVDPTRNSIRRADFGLRLRSSTTMPPGHGTRSDPHDPGNAPFSGDVGKYGLGVFLGTRSDAGFWMTPVVEALGWTCIGGSTEIVDPSGIQFRGAAGSTTVSGAAGLRMGLGREVEIYGGYDRCVTTRLGAVS